jgi:Tfp pilus assembly protein PilF
MGYDRDTIATYLVDRELYEVAEIQLRRAVWLNPYEPRFKAHLAWCLYKQKRYAEAREWIAQACAQPPMSEEAERLRAIVNAQV